MNQQTQRLFALAIFIMPGMLASESCGWQETGDDDAVEVLIKKLDSANFVERRIAQQSLTKRKPEPVESVLKVFANSEFSRETRIRCSEILKTWAKGDSYRLQTRVRDSIARFEKKYPEQKDPFLRLKQALFLEDEARMLVYRLNSADEKEEREIFQRLRDIGLEARIAANKMLEYDNDWVSGVTASMGPEIIPRLKTRLRSKNHSRQSWTLEAASSMRHDAAPLIPHIVELTKHRNSDVRSQAVKTLSELNLRHDITVPALVELFDHKDHYFVTEACEALWEMGEKAKAAAPALRKLVLEHEDAYVRARALLAISTVDPYSDETIQLYGKALKDDGWYGTQFSISIRSLVFEDLNAVGDRAKSISPSIFKLFQDKEVRATWMHDDIAFLLAVTGEKEAIRLLKADFQKPTEKKQPGLFSSHLPETYQDTCRRVISAGALAILNPADKDATQYLYEIVEDKEWNSTSFSGPKGMTFTDPRCSAVLALGRLGDKKHLPILKKTMKNGGRLGMAAAWAIARTEPNDKACVEVLAKADFSFPKMHTSPFYRESPDSIAKILGDRITKLEQPIIEEAFDFNSDSEEFYFELLRNMKPSPFPKLFKNVISASTSEVGKTHPDYDWYQEIGLVKRFRIIEKILPCLKDQEAVASGLVSLLDSVDLNVRANALRLLGKLDKHNKKTIDAMILKLDDPRAIVRGWAADALGRSRSPSAEILKKLKPMTDDRYYFVREKAKAAIARLQ